MSLWDEILAFEIGFGSPGWDLGLKAGIWASRLEFEGGTEKKEKKEKEEKIPHMCESIGR